MQVPLFTPERMIRSLRRDLLEAIEGVLDRGQFILGSEVRFLEQELALRIGVPAAIGVASGTDALLIALLALGIQPGDEVVTTPFTFAATATTVVRAGARPVFADIAPDTFNLDPARMTEALSPRTRAVIPVHLYGHPCDMEPILACSARNGGYGPGVTGEPVEQSLFIIEDAAQALGAQYQGKPAGAIGDAGCFSFFPTKPLGAFGDGGLVVTRHPSLEPRFRSLRAHGQSGRKYYHDEPGLNSRLDEMQAALLRVRLRRIDEWEAERREAAALYGEVIGDLSGRAGVEIVLPMERPGCRHVYHQYTVRVPARDAVQEALSQRGIGTAVYYPWPLHLQECFRNLGYRPGNFPEAERACREVLSLPMFPGITAGELTCVSEALVEAAAVGKKKGK
ncbi:MAG: DegT/DnrJ/EryC1/StrS family aminotransferase [Firmicutes bacterium]|nr:DegT/DnrJ/EryC1/StrS family aminotransferase [Bacillota bacterium]